MGRRRDVVPFKLVREVACTGGWVESTDEEDARHWVGREGQCSKKRTGLVVFVLWRMVCPRSRALQRDESSGTPPTPTNPLLEICPLCHSQLTCHPSLPQLPSTYLPCSSSTLSSCTLWKTEMELQDYKINKITVIVTGPFVWVDYCSQGF